MQVLADRFELEKVVGTGGMGEVYRAKDRLTGKQVAVKLLFASLHGDVDRFQREALLLAELHHPRIVRYVAHGVTPTGRAYLAMEWLEGEDLGDRLTHRPLSVAETIAVGRRVAEALAALHERGVVHRDVKPSNVFLVGGLSNDVKLLDLGVARLTSGARQATHSGVMIGTPGYMAPEQARGQRDVDARADVFALGCVLFECLANRPAFVGDNMPALLAKILLEPSPRISSLVPNVPPELDDLVARMLEKHALDRPANGAAVLRALEELHAEELPIESRPSGQHPRAITGGERQLVSVVMARLPELDADDVVPSTRPTADETAIASFDLRTVAAAFGADFAVLADGSIVFVLARARGATEQATDAARFALSLRSHLPGATIALATGLATVTGMSVVGDVIERAAAQLESARSRGGGGSSDSLHGHAPVFLDDTSAGLLDLRFDVGGDDRGLFIRGLREREGRARTVLGRATPCVGRERELSSLVGLYAECRDEGVARVVVVTGAAGVGKTRLLGELRARLEAEGATVWVGGADPMRSGAPFGLLARAVRRAAGVEEGDSLVVRQHKLRARVGRHLTAERAQRVAEFVGEIATTPFDERASVELRAARLDPILMGDQIRRAWDEWIEAETSAQPLVLVLEDLHWGDLPSVRLVDGALRANADRPLLVVGLARPEVTDLFPHLWAERHAQEIRLGPLLKRASETLARAVLGDDASATDVESIVARAGGNPFFLEELARAQKDGEPALPGSILAMLEARVERLEPPARRLLRAASVFGEVFWRAGVQALVGTALGAADVQQWLADLVLREVVVERRRSSLGRDDEYAFSHALVREVAYATLTPEDRALGHRLAGEWLERSGERQAVVLADHFARAEDRARAERFYTVAAEQALEANDFALAARLARRALELGAEKHAGALELVLAEAAAWSGDPSSASAHAAAALELEGVGSDGWFGAAATLADAALKRGDAARVSEIAARVADVPWSGTPSVTRVVATSRVLASVARATSFAPHEGLVEQLETHASPIAATEPLARGWLLAARALSAAWSGDVSAEAALTGEAAAAFAEAGDARSSCVHRVRAALALTRLGAFGDAEILLHAVVADADRLGLPSLLLLARQTLGQLYTRRGDVSAARAVLRDCLERAKEQGSTFDEGVTYVYLAGTSRVANDQAAAEREARAAIERLQGSRYYNAGAQALLAMALVDQGRAPEALPFADAAMTTLRELGGAVEGELIIHLAWAEALGSTGDEARAKVAIKEARERLMTKAKRIGDPERRKAFLTHIREHGRILARAGEWLIDE